ncbi:MAG: hypothetical protein JGK17_31825 [Microcoleus sp. PH2017_10_PVI_O_A]|uniref:hypothetical protein n=1 Tax=unclassified Microcoleus TaxID=2642155 RepID=UPI001DA5612C|nr:MULTISPECIES: hypothetical protein [unclassified Microcoleus]MCC3530866.1 hypothetical protein [Microcoleus sp. PH2017_21_RUC_O_A]MCC3410044.1 hypothetical protein [Microcoleus sp. PH2017_10_PVI_O_A]MCC3464310.1 hypothetical protein [Microcoleus sp. PH2017_11_PCY_U_A]MCC3482656.1 hypothetical protein [Microcoleus sp. PH2017_12_PCY_D_A]MCC3563633.1 hypothetical protein [Microcoleus sp. PH2017_27_LUM_O_A]
MSNASLTKESNRRQAANHIQSVILNLNSPTCTIAIYQSAQPFMKSNNLKYQIISFGDNMT